MSEKTIGRRIATGGLVLVLLRLALRGIGLISIVILFRILDAADFGIVALGSLVVGLIEVFSEFGFDQALLRNANAVRHDYDVAWTLNCLRGLAVAALLALSAPFASRFLEESRLASVLFALSLAPLLDGMQNIGTVDFSKKLEFQKEFLLKVGQKLVSFTVTLVAAFLLRNYWALVIGLLSGRVAGVVLGYALHPYRPRWSLQGWRGLLRFSIWILVNNIVLYAGNQTDKVVVQRSFNAHVVGILRIAEEISGMVMELVWPIEKALYAGYVQVVHEAARFRRVLMSSTGLVAAIGVPVSLGLGVLAEPAVSIVLGVKGREAVPFIQVYVLHGAIRSCVCGVFPVFMVLGRPEVNTQVTFAAVAVRLGVLLTAFPVFGLMAVPWSMVAGSTVTFLLLWWRLTTAMELPALYLPTSLWRSVASSLIMAIAGRFGLLVLHGQLSDALTLALLIPGCAAVYLLALVGLWALCGRPEGPERAGLNAVWTWWLARQAGAAAA